MALSTLAQNSYAIISLLHAKRITDELNSRNSQLCAEDAFEIRLIGQEKGHVGRVGSQKEGLLPGRLHRAENPYSLVHSFVTIANGTKANGAPRDQIGESLNRRTLVDQSRSHDHAARLYVVAVEFSQKS